MYINIFAKGRLVQSDLPVDAITPFFLPNKSYLVDLLITHIHTSHHHIGLSQTLSLYRQRCWTPKIRSRIKGILLRCVICQRVKKGTISRPLPSPLQAEQVKWVQPFSNVDVDHTGSFAIRDPQGRKTKAYICLFVCTTTRAVHLEVVDNLTNTSFIMCLKRHAASKGMPTLLLSDNHKIITGETFLLEMQQDPAVQEYLSTNRIRWKHQTLRSPWMGGHFERLVRTVKASLATAISRKLLTLEELSTVIKEAENIVNSRPLTYQSDSSRDIPLTPSQSAWGRDLTLMPPLLQPGDPLDEDYDAKTTRVQYIVLSNALEQFRKRWHNEYLLALREKHYNLCAENSSHHLRIGQLVMVKHDNIHRIEWPLGVITAIYPDERGVVRTAEVEECGNRLLRSVTYLVPLELDCHHSDDNERQRLREGEEGDNDEDNHSLVSPAGATGHNFPPDASTSESNLYRTPGSSRASCPPIGTTEQCSITTEGETGTPHTLPSTLSPSLSVLSQTSWGEESEAEAGEPVIRARQPRAAAVRQRGLMRNLLNDDLI